MTISVQGSRRAWLLACVVALMLISFSIPSSAYGATRPAPFKAGTVDAGAEQSFLSKTNALRASRGLGPLRSNSELLAKARAWSQTQASSGTIFHSTLTSGVTQNWHRLGENVGMGPEVGPIHDALVRSPRHYENLTDSGFTEVGIGVVRQGDIVYVTEVFMELMPSSSPATTQPHSTSHNRSHSSRTSAVPAATTSHSSTPIAEAAPLKTASADLSAIILKLSSLEK